MKLPPLIPSRRCSRPRKHASIPSQPHDLVSKQRKLAREKVVPVPELLQLAAERVVGCEERVVFLQQFSLVILSRPARGLAFPHETAKRADGLGLVLCNCLQHQLCRHPLGLSPSIRGLPNIRPRQCPNLSCKTRREPFLVEKRHPSLPYHAPRVSGRI